MNNQQKANRAWNKAQSSNTLRMDESQTGQYYDYLALEDFRQMTEGEKAKLSDHVRRDYEEAISNIFFAKQEDLERLEEVALEVGGQQCQSKADSTL